MNESSTFLNIYLITNSVNGKVYVGKTEKTIESRLYEHRGNARRGGDFRLSQAIRKHGAEAFTIATIEVAHFLEAGARERFWIAHYNSKVYANGYNMTDGGEGKPGVLMTEEAHENMRRAQQARFSVMSDEDKAALTKVANDAKRGKKEKPSNKKEAQQKRWTNTTPQQRAEHGKRCQENITEEGKLRQIKGMCEAFSPVRTKGYKQEIVACPKCGKEGGAAAMKRYHFERCKF